MAGLHGSGWLTGLATDQQTFFERLKFRLAMYSLREVGGWVTVRGAHGRAGEAHQARVLRKARVNAPLRKAVRAWQRSRRRENKPYLFSSDFIGAPLLPDMETNGFVVAGTCTEQLMGMCESMWRKGQKSSREFLSPHTHSAADLEPEELFETVSQCLLAGQDRDCLSGWGAVVHIMCGSRRLVVSR
eukprot:768613-Hanusia_phi.AAC.3